MIFFSTNRDFDHLIWT